MFNILLSFNWTSNPIFLLLDNTKAAISRECDIEILNSEFSDGLPSRSYVII